MFRKITFIGLVALIACAPLAQAQEGLFAVPVKTTRPIPPEGRSVLFLLYSISENFQFDIKANGVDLKTLDNYTFRGKIQDMPMSAAILKILKDSGVTGIKCRFDNDTDTLYLSGTGSSEPMRAKNDKPAPENTKPQQRAVAARTEPEQANDKPATKPSPADTRKPTERLAVNRRFTQPAIEASNRPARVTETETEEVITYSAPGPDRLPEPVNNSGWGNPAQVYPAYQGTGLGLPRLSTPRTRLVYGNGVGLENRYSGSWSNYYGSGYYRGYGYVNPLVTAEWCANFPANRLCTHGVIKIDSPEFPDVDMYLTPLDPQGLAVAPRSNLGPVSKHNSVFNKGYYVPVGFYRVEFVNKGKDLILFEDAIRVEASYVNQGHPQVLRVDKNRFKNEPVKSLIEQEEPKRKTVAEWQEDR